MPPDDPRAAGRVGCAGGARDREHLRARRPHAGGARLASGCSCIGGSTPASRARGTASRSRPSGGMEWIQDRVKADTDTYARRAIPLFKPKPGFAREWARLAKDAGCAVCRLHHQAPRRLRAARFEGERLRRGLGAAPRPRQGNRGRPARRGAARRLLPFGDRLASRPVRVRAIAATATSARGTAVPEREARPPEVPRVPARAGERAACRTTARGRPVVGLQRAGLPGRRGMARLRSDRLARGKQPASS